jgi:hypothetical protein
MNNKALVARGPVRMVFNSAVDRLRIARDRRKQRQELVAMKQNKKCLLLAHSGH